jgi:hypothetical protein
MNDQLYPEPMVARVTGLSRTILKRARGKGLEKGTDWLLVKSVVTYPAGGLKKLLASAGVDSAALAWPIPPGAPLDSPAVDGGAALDATGVAAAIEELVQPEWVEIVVERVVPNPTILFARHGAETVRVRVRSNENFVQGMKIKARPPEDEGGLWWLVGNCPRWKGRF